MEYSCFWWGSCELNISLLIIISFTTGNYFSSPALGQGWRLGFLGLLHMDVFNQRLEQEYNANVIVTVPSVPFKSKLKSTKTNQKLYGPNQEIIIQNPANVRELLSWFCNYYLYDSFCILTFNPSMGETTYFQNKLWNFPWPVIGAKLFAAKRLLYSRLLFQSCVCDRFSLSSIVCVLTCAWL